MAVLKSGEIDSFVARPDPARPIVLVYGPDAGLVGERVQALLRASVDDPRDALAVTRLSGDELASDPARLVDEAQAIPMFGGRRAIVIRAGARNMLPALETLLAARAECRVIIEAGDLKRTAALRVLCERASQAAVLPCYADSARDIERLIDAEMRDAGLTIAPEARALLTPLLGADRRASRNELRKLALYAHGRGRVGVDDVMATVVDSSAVAIESLLDAVFAGQPRDVERHFDKAVAAGTSPGAVVGGALRHVTQLHRMKVSVESGARVEDAIGPSVFFRRKPALEMALRVWTSGALQTAMSELASCALQVRTQPALDLMLIRHCLLRIATKARAERARAAH